MLLSAVGVSSYRMFTGAEEPFFTAPFTSPSPVVLDFGPTPCPASVDAKYPAPKKVTVNTLNASALQGAAAAASQSLETRGFKTGEVKNAGIDFAGTILIRTGAKGVDRAYTLLAHAPADAVLAFDARDDDSVDLVVGEEYEGLRPVAEVAVESGAVIETPPQCTPVAELVASADSAAEPPPPEPK
ncbi:MAG: LytR C-terminal domain-containing protein [Bifidobacteriaceae bacterium]|nr:LytR C-terminal domain-containing protein [Bifidobacteriaceae bacterium]